MKLTQIPGPTLGGQKPKGRKNSTCFKEEFNFLESSNTITSNKTKQKNTERQRNTTQMKAQERNTEVQINIEEIGKLPEKEFRKMIVKMIKTLENKMEKM